MIVNILVTFREYNIFMMSVRLKTNNTVIQFLVGRVSTPNTTITVQ